MEFSTQTSAAFHQVKSAALIVGVFTDGQLSAAADVIDRASDHAIKSLVGHDFLGQVGEAMVLRNLSGVRATRVIVVGLGKQADYSTKTYAKAEQAAARQCVSLRITDACTALPLVPCPGSEPEQLSKLAAQTYWHAILCLRNDLEQAGPAKKIKLNKVSVLCDRKARKSCQHRTRPRRRAGPRHRGWTRQLGNLPANICTPTYLGNQARVLGRQFKSIKVSVLEKNN